MTKRGAPRLRSMWFGMMSAATTLLLAPSTGWAGMGQPSPWQRGLQDAATPVSEGIHWFYDLVNFLIIAITVFVSVLMAYVMYRFSDKRNATPSRVTHNTTLEVLWTVLPILILVVIAIPSFKLLYLQYSYPPPDVTIKAIGNAWFWEHEYPDYGGFKVTSNMLRDEDVLKVKYNKEDYDRRYKSLEGMALTKQQYADAKPVWDEQKKVRQLSVDNEIAVPVNKVVHVLVTASDVIHNWTIPSFGSKLDAVPGRVAATWFKPTKTGVFYGQCSELCGKDHANMPIAVRVVSQQAFDTWAGALKAAKEERDPAKRRENINRARETLRQAAIDDETKSTVKLAGGK